MTIFVKITKKKTKHVGHWMPQGDTRYKGANLKTKKLISAPALSNAMVCWFKVCWFKVCWFKG